MFLHVRLDITQEKYTHIKGQCGKPLEALKTKIDR